MPLILIDSNLIFTMCIIHAVSNRVTLDMTLHSVFCKFILIPPECEEEFCAGGHALGQIAQVVESHPLVIFQDYLTTILCNVLWMTLLEEGGGTSPTM